MYSSRFTTLASCTCWFDASLSHILTHISQQLRIIYVNRKRIPLIFINCKEPTIGPLHGTHCRKCAFFIDITQLNANANKHSINTYERWYVWQICSQCIQYVCMYERSTFAITRTNTQNQHMHMHTHT